MFLDRRGGRGSAVRVGQGVKAGPLSSGVDFDLFADEVVLD